MLSSLTLHAAPECTIWALAGAVSERMDTHARTDRHEAIQTYTYTHRHTQTQGEKPHYIFNNISAAEKNKGHSLLGAFVTLVLVSMTQINKYIALLLHLHEQKLLEC